MVYSTRIRNLIPAAIAICLIAGMLSGPAYARELAPGLPAPEKEQQKSWRSFLKLRRGSNAEDGSTSGLAIEAKAEMRRGNFRSAERLYQRALKHQPNDENLNFELAEVLYRRDKPDAARQHVDIVIQNGSSRVEDAARLKLKMESKAGNHEHARAAAQSLAAWAEKSDDVLTAIENRLLASRISHENLNDASGTYYNLEKAKFLMDSADEETRAKVSEFEAEITRTRMGQPNPLPETVPSNMLKEPTIP